VHRRCRRKQRAQMLSRNNGVIMRCRCRSLARPVWRGALAWAERCQCTKSSAGSEHTTWKYGTGNSSASRSANHSRAAALWHFGQCRLRQELLYFCGGSTGESSARTPMTPTIRQRSMIFSMDVPRTLLCNRGTDVWGECSPKLLPNREIYCGFAVLIRADRC
jgi:hypothetical protein